MQHQTPELRVPAIYLRRQRGQVVGARLHARDAEQVHVVFQHLAIFQDDVLVGHNHAFERNGAHCIQRLYELEVASGGTDQRIPHALGKAVDGRLRVKVILVGAVEQIGKDDKYCLLSAWRRGRHAQDLYVSRSICGDCLKHLEAKALHLFTILQ